MKKIGLIAVLMMTLAGLVIGGNVPVMGAGTAGEQSRQMQLAALPEAGGPPPPPPKKPYVDEVHEYTGVIQNKTKYDLSVPSANSNGTIIVPAKGYVEFTIWGPTYDLIVYREALPFHCETVKVNPKAFPFMCKNYDFMTVIVKGDFEPAPKYKKMKRRIRKNV